MTDDREVLARVLERLLFLQKMRETALAHFAFLGVNSKFRMRASAVAKAVAEKLDMNDGPYFRRDLTEAMRSVGWRAVMRGHRRFWKGVVTK